MAAETMRLVTLAEDNKVALSGLVVALKSRNFS